MEIFIMAERIQSKRKFARMKVCEADEVREYFINPKIENECINLIWISEIFHALFVKIYCQK